MFYYRTTVRGCGIACASAPHSGCAAPCPLRDGHVPGGCTRYLWAESDVVIGLLDLWATPQALALAKVKNASVFRTTR